MDNTLTFGQSWTVAEFKAFKGISKLRIVRNPKTKKHFLADELGRTLGNISSNRDSSRPQCISEVTDIENNSWYMLHNVQESNVVEEL